MSLAFRLNKLEVRAKNIEHKIEKKPDLSDFTDIELRLLLDLLDNGQEDTAEAQALLNKIRWVNVCPIKTDLKNLKYN